MIDRNELAKEIFVHASLNSLPANLLVKGYDKFRRSVVKTAYAWADIFLAVQKEEPIRDSFQRKAGRCV
jgi:hypothetical protein